MRLATFEGLLRIRGEFVREDIGRVFNKKLERLFQAFERELFREEVKRDLQITAKTCY